MFPCPVGHISFFSCTAHFPSVSTVSVFPPLLHCCWHIRSMPSAVCPWSLALYPTMSLFSSHAYWNDSADTAHPISVIEMISSPNASMTLLPLVEGKKKLRHIIWWWSISVASSPVTCLSIVSWLWAFYFVAQQRTRNLYFSPFHHQVLPNLQNINQASSFLEDYPIFTLPNANCIWCYIVTSIKI